MNSATCLPSNHHAGTSSSQCRGTIHIVEQLAAGGIETLVLDFLRDDPETLAVFSLRGTADALVRGWPALDGFRDRIVGFDRRPGIQPWLVLTITLGLRKLRPETVIVHHIGPLLYGGLAARIAGVRNLIHVEHDAWHYQQARRRQLGRWSVGLLRPRVVAVSQQVADSLVAVMPGRKITVIPPGISPDRFQPADKKRARQPLSLDPHWKVVGTVGRLETVKGHRFLLDAIAQLPDSVHLVIVGDGRERQALQAQALARNIANRVHFLGQRNDLPDVYPAFDVFCLPSVAEGLPRVALEAQACGVPVVASRVGGVAEALCPHSGILVPPENPAAVAQALRTLLDRSIDVNSPRKHVEENLSWSRTLHRYRALVETP